MEALLSTNGLRKHFSVPVLNGIDFELRRGEVHALMGANGAGKTTLCNIVCGLLPPSGGSMCYKGEAYVPGSVNDAEAAGIRMVMQELNLIANLSVAENIYFRSLPHRRGFIHFEKMYDQARDALAAIGLRDIDPRDKLGKLGLGQQQLVEIARNLVNPGELLILDEPTAALTAPQIDLLFEIVAERKRQGVGIIYVSHRLGEIGTIADQVTVLRDGRCVQSCAVGETSKDEIIRNMAGAGVREKARVATRQRGSIAIRVDALGVDGVLSDIHLDIHYGEILGIAGLIGSGRTELLRAIYGADPIDAGCLRVGPALAKIHLTSPADAVAHGIGLVPEDRKRQGLLLTRSVADNMSLAALTKFRKTGGWIDRDREKRIAREYLQALEIKTTGTAQSVRELSGGNQQKVTIARWLIKDSDILLFDEPTRGIDIQSRIMIYALLRDLADQGKAIVMVSSETDELEHIADRIGVMSGGRLAALYPRGEWSGEKIMAAAFSAYDGSRVA